jgi:hypothetical protein
MALYDASKGLSLGAWNDQVSLPKLWKIELHLGMLGNGK